MSKFAAEAWDDEINIGATFYREVTPYSDAAKTVPVDPAGKTPRGVLLKPNGEKAADFGCSWLESGAIAWTMPRATTAALQPGRRYQHFLYLDEGDTTDCVLQGIMTTTYGEEP